MKNSIPRYTFYKHKYGSELLVDVVELKYVKKFLAKSTVHTLNYYDITFITEGKGAFSVDNQTYEAIPCDVLFSKPGEIRNWDTHHIINGYALIFEEEFLSSLFKDIFKEGRQKLFFENQSIPIDDMMSIPVPDFPRFREKNVTWNCFIGLVID